MLSVSVFTFCVSARVSVGIEVAYSRYDVTHHDRNQYPIRVTGSSATSVRLGEACTCERKNHLPQQVTTMPLVVLVSVQSARTVVTVRV